MVMFLPTHEVNPDSWVQNRAMPSPALTRSWSVCAGRAPRGGRIAPVQPGPADQSAGPSAGPRRAASGSGNVSLRTVASGAQGSESRAKITTHNLGCVGEAAVSIPAGSGPRRQARGRRGGADVEPGHVGQALNLHHVGDEALLVVVRVDALLQLLEPGDITGIHGVLALAAKAPGHQTPFSPASALGAKMRRG